MTLMTSELGWTAKFAIKSYITQGHSELHHEDVFFFFFFFSMWGSSESEKALHIFSQFFNQLMFASLSYCAKLGLWIFKSKEYVSFPTLFQA